MRYPKAKITYEYLSGLLNSSLLDYLVHKKSTKFHGGYYSYAKRFIDWLPVKIPESIDEKHLANRIENLVKEILCCCTTRKSFVMNWLSWSNKLHNSQRTLLDVLISDLDAIRTGNHDRSWFSKVSFYQDKYPEMWKKKYHDFKLYGDIQRLKISIYGLYEAEEQQIYNIEFDDEHLLQHVYLSILSLLDSKREVHTLWQLFEKTIIDVIQPNLKTNTPNIIKKVLSNLQQRDSTIVNVISIDAMIEECEEKIDSIVYRLYDFSEVEIDTTMKWLSLREKYRQKVKEHFNDSSY